MQSSGDWINVPSLTHRQSVDSGSGTDVFSLINANPQLSETSYLNLDTSKNMAQLPGSGNPSSENLPPIRPAVVDWVQEQSQDNHPSNDATGLQRPSLDGTTPHLIGQAKQPRDQIDDHASCQQSCQPAKNIYDIPTLLRLKETQSAVPVMLRVKPEAIAENIFQYMGAATSRRPPTRSRCLSDVSNISSGVPESHSHTVYPAARPKYMTQPFRQPHAPPETSILQRHDGFARFLKQHASPPHHRVTAGGRIVPAGPSSPPPMLDFGSLNGLLRDRPATAKSFQKESRSSQSNPRAQNPQATSAMTLADYLQAQGSSIGGVSLQHAAQPSPMQTATPFSNLPFGYQPFIAPATQTQATLVPLAMFPDGSTLVTYNGMNYRASWNGMTTTMEPLQPLQVATDQQYYTQAYPQGYLDSSHYSVLPQPSQACVPSVPLVSATNVTRSDNSKVERALQHQTQNGGELSLKTQLTNLDKHLALYHYDITPADRASLIAQRKCLVEEIDRIRLSKEKPKHSIPIIAPAASGLPVTPAAQLASGPNGLSEAVQDDRIVKGGTMNKYLSPAAPAFVPRNISNLPPTGLGVRIASQQSKKEQHRLRASSGGIDTAPRTQNSEISSTRNGPPDHKIPFPKTQTTLHNEESSASSLLDPSDPAMRIIDYEDIEYAARYLYNWTKDSKTYCTTVAEFQEAIRRVREQARLYGCAGGQSKDPAYDAEQDIWWAICDRDPIPLPSKVPDHVTKPRPWNWNDSDFNYRRQGANSTPGPGCEHARNSPRIVGWDPATTDKMKDMMDVSRSYFALKGQLPSVPFRESSYDQDGNKSLIQPDPGVPSAYADFSKNTADRGRSPMEGLGREQTVSKNKPSNQHTGSASKTPYKLIDEGIAPEAVSSPQGVPRTPENMRIQPPLVASNIHLPRQVSKPHLSTGHEVTKFKNPEIINNPHHAYVEEYPETPLARGVRSASKRVLTSQMKLAPFKAHLSPLPTANIDARTESVGPTNTLNFTMLPDPSRELTAEELNSIWYQTPLDEVTQKYLDDMKAYNPFENKPTNENNHHIDTAKIHRQGSNSSEPVAESKSQWGPEENTTPTNASHCIESRARVEEHGVLKSAKVKIPSASTLLAPVPRANGNDLFSTGFNAPSTLDSREVNAINVPSIERNDSHNFLRKMLKSPRYSSVQPMSILSQMSSTLAEKVNSPRQSQANSTEQRPENKGNIASYKYGTTGVIGSGPYTISRPPMSASLARTKPNLAVSKAQSSLASSTYQAHGYLPHFDGAGKAHTSSVYREQGIQPLPQVRLPSEALYGDGQHAAETSSHHDANSHAYTASTTYHNPVNFGYDGGRDSPPPKATNAPNTQQSDRPGFDFMGVTQADYDNHRGDTDNAWHRGAVKDFFQDLREQELRTIASHQRVNTRSAA